MQQLMPGTDISLSYQRGWSRAISLSEILQQSQDRDLERGYTYYGPQRAELGISLDSRSARDTASRGQKKLITYGLYIAQAQVQESQGRYSGLLLVDDLPSELDQEHQSSVLILLADLPMQVILSCIEPSEIENSLRSSAKMFHVKQGQVKEVIQ